MTSSQTLTKVVCFKFNINFVFARSTIDTINRTLNRIQTESSTESIKNRTKFLQFLSSEFHVDFQNTNNGPSHIMLRTGQNDLLSLVKGDRLKLNRLSRYLNQNIGGGLEGCDISSSFIESISLISKTTHSTNLAQELINSSILIIEISLVLKEISLKSTDHIKVISNIRTILLRTKLAESHLMPIIILVDKIIPSQRVAEIKKITLTIFIQILRNSRSSFRVILAEYENILQTCINQKDGIQEILNIYRQTMGFDVLSYNPTLSLEIFKLTYQALNNALSKNQDKSFQNLIEFGYTKIGLFLFFTDLSRVVKFKDIDKNQALLFHANLNRLIKLRIDNNTKNLSIVYRAVLVRIHKMALESMCDYQGDHQAAKEDFLNKLKLFFKNITMFGGKVFDLLSDLKNTNTLIENLQNDTDLDFDERDDKYEIHVNSYCYNKDQLAVFMEFIYENNFV